MPNDDPDCGKLMNNATRKIGNQESFMDSGQCHYASQPEPFKLGTTPWSLLKKRNEKMEFFMFKARS